MRKGKIFALSMCILLVIVSLIAVWKYQFTHIDETHTRVLVNNWYWYVAMLVGYFGYLIIGYKSKR